MDKLNEKILVELQKNARISYAEIGRKVGLTAPAVAERVQKLEESGIIQGYKAVLDVSKLGYSLKALITFKIYTGKLDSFLNFLKQKEEVYECLRVTGNDCLVIHVMIRNPAHLEKLINEFLPFGEPTTSIVLSSPIEGKVLENFYQHS
jgi:Lrp/AsnC family transcriptional regulator, leucine-responsive regulatory protein